MKMFGKKSLSTLLFYVTRVTAIGYGVFLLFIAFAMVTNSFLNISGNNFQIKIPYTDSVIKGVYEINTFASIIVFFFFYASFFYVLSLVFETFKAETLFSKNAIKHLTYFTIINLFFPVLYGSIQLLIFQGGNFNDLYAVFLHIILGVFALFIATIFRQGVQLQEENELTI
ncbi:DUF2975 domain-containing protein [Aquimarina macrocephali]|uniref:DUF2975 domain-containing protein n=1 Tax=Aquimarina macrocephali TaxID=666563 RepID=UPI00046373C3|nr:DUF2975 domain-containing protein [Aquimarina macrocephali]